jgi:hypothetical protein
MIEIFFSNNSPITMFHGLWPFEPVASLIYSLPALLPFVKSETQNEKIIQSSSPTRPSNSTSVPAPSTFSTFSAEQSVPQLRASLLVILNRLIPITRSPLVSIHDHGL